MRLFIGIEIKTNKEIKEVLEALKIEGKKVREENFHITLKFLGELDSYEKIIDELRIIKFEKFKLILRGIGTFPSEKKARVLYVSAESNGKLEQLAEMVDKATFQIKMDHPFSPHLTIMRFKSPYNATEIVQNYRSKYFGSYDIDSYNLYSSQLTPTGPIYKIIEKFQLI